ncbi:lysine-specific histone demethylase 1-like protein 3-like [Hibiscus syriacus]|uniref:Lysine-specific histone demethylase 1-like protein 3-like n=1 Tax=Hibiscus syriacus TaxID=106335 RepID=A0A6A3B885_HIBSY|nr:uncharacterized protein LOC120115537 [Hibiscus syriacus]KAE8711988.1 lysine-specific histone demethylase 1-like protein 3-like [Hibiscus syriacus]
MEDQWGFCPNEEGMEDLKHTLLFTTMELENTLISAKEEVTKRDLELIHLKDVLSKTMRERDDARRRCRNLVLEKFVLLEQQSQHKQVQHETASLSGVSSSDDESNLSLVSSPDSDLLPQSSAAALKLAANRPLPEQGRLLQAVKDAGPLLQNILLAGPLPQWQHPPPQLAVIEIPPVAISSPKQQLLKQESFNNVNVCLGKKRGIENYEDFESSPNTKYHKVALH